MKFCNYDYDFAKNEEQEIIIDLLERLETTTWNLIYRHINEDVWEENIKIAQEIVEDYFKKKGKIK